MVIGAADLDDLLDLLDVRQTLRILSLVNKSPLKTCLQKAKSSRIYYI